MKKVLLMLLGVLMALPALARDFSYTYEGKTLTYTVIDEDAKTVKTKDGFVSQVSTGSGNNVSGNLVLPSNPKDGDVEYTLTSIGSWAFYKCSGLTSVTIPNSVTSIGSSAFRGCSGLTSVTVPNSVTSIGESAFMGCSGLKSVTISESVTSIGEAAFYKCTGLTSVTIPSKVTSIGWSTFYGCSRLTSVTIPEAVTSIGSSAFYECSGLSSVTIPASVTSIGSSAFYGCSGLSSVTIPASVTSIGSSAFSGCSGLKKSTYPNTLSNPFPSGTCIAYDPEGAIIEDGIVWGKDKTAIYFAPLSLAGEFTILEAVTSIGREAFYGCSGLTSVTIPASVTLIGSSAFSGCSGLASVVSLAETAPAIQTNSFEGLYNTVEAIVPDNSLSSYLTSNWAFFDNMKTAGGVEAKKFTDDVFQYRVSGENSAMLIAGNYGSMTSVSIPERVVVNDKFHYVTYIGDGAFKNCKNITKLVFPKRLEGIGVSAFEGAKIAVSDISLPTTLTKIHDSAFNGTTGISSFTLPEKVDYIGNSAFAGSSIAKINLSAAPGIECFKYAKNLSSVTFAEKVDTIATEAFYGCVKLANITLPQSLTEIGSTAFYGCTGLTKIAFNAGLAEIGTSAFSGCTGLTEINLPESLQNIGNYAFKNCSSLTKAYVTASVPEECFYSDSKLAEVVMTDDVYSIGDNAFQNCTGLTSVTIGNSVESIGTLAFSGCSGLTELTLGNSLASIGTAAFYQCSGLTSTLTIPQSVTNIGYGAFWQTNYQKVEYNAENCSVVTADASMGTGISSPFPTTMEGLIIGNSVNIIPESAFLGRNKLTSVTFGSSVDSIGADAFNGCNLTELVLSPATKSIGEKAFAGNNLKNIALGCNVTKIDAKAFDGANSLKGVSITALTPPAAENTTFSYYDCPLYVSPSENDVVKDAYYNFTRCWYRFSGYDLIPIKEVTVTGNSSINLKPGESVKLTATFTPADASLPYIFWRSTNPAIATVDKDGNVTMVAKDSDVETYSDEAASCQIIAETLYADGPVASVTIVEASSGIDDVVIDEPAVAPTRPNDIYNLQGICLKRNATDDDVKALAPGLYIVSGKKILVK